MKGIDDFTTAWEAVPNAFVCDGRSVWCHGAQSHFPSDCGMCENAPTKWVHLVEMDFLCFSKTPPLEVFPVPLANAPLCQCWGKWSFECGELQCDCQLSCIPRWLDCHWQWHSRWLHYFHCCCCCPVSFPWCRPSDEAMSSFRCKFATDLNELWIEKIQFVTQVAMTSSKEHCSWMCFSVSTRERESHGSPDMSPMHQRERRKFSLKVFDDGNGEFQRFDDWRFWWWKRKCAFYSFNVSMMEMDMSLVPIDCESVTVMFDVINATLCLCRGKAWKLWSATMAMKAEKTELTQRHSIYVIKLCVLGECCLGATESRKRSLFECCIQLLWTSTWKDHFIQRVKRKTNKCFHVNGFGVTPEQTLFDPKLKDCFALRECQWKLTNSSLSQHQKTLENDSFEFGFRISVGRLTSNRSQVEQWFFVPVFWYGFPHGSHEFVNMLHILCHWCCSFRCDGLKCPLWVAFAGGNERWWWKFIAWTNQKEFASVLLARCFNFAVRTLVAVFVIEFWKGVVWMHGGLAKGCRGFNWLSNVACAQNCESSAEWIETLHQRSPSEDRSLVPEAGWTIFLDDCCCALLRCTMVTLLRVSNTNLF